MADVKIVWILVCTIISNSAYALVAPFLPIVFKQKGISGQMVGLIFAIYSIAVIICSPFVGRTVEFVGNATMISIGIAVIGLAFVLFGFIPDLGEISTICREFLIAFLARGSIRLCPNYMLLDRHE